MPTSSREDFVNGLLTWPRPGVVPSLGLAKRGPVHLVEARTEPHRAVGTVSNGGTLFKRALQSIDGGEHTMPRTIVLFLVITFIEATFAAAFADEADGWSNKEKLENFQLYVSECNLIGIEIYFKVHKGVALTRKSIETAARSRLRAARLYGGLSDPVSGVLAISVVATSWGSHYRVWFLKRQLDEMSQISNWSPAGWTRGHSSQALSTPLCLLRGALTNFWTIF